MKDNKIVSIAGLIIGVALILFVIWQMDGDESSELGLTTTPSPTARPTVMQQTPTPVHNKQYASAPDVTLEEGVDYKARIVTNKGEMLVDLHENRTPLTVNNFVFLARDGYYDGVPFHRIIKDFMIQTGDPTGTGAGSPGYTFPDEEFEGNYAKGTIAMANAGPDTNGSQFFIMPADYPLQPNYVIFGQVTEGLDIVDEIANTPVAANAYGELSVPQEEVRIESVEIITE